MTATVNITIECTVHGTFSVPDFKTAGEMETDHANCEALEMPTPEQDDAMLAAMAEVEADEAAPVTFDKVCFNCENEGMPGGCVACGMDETPEPCDHALKAWSDGAWKCMDCGLQQNAED